MGPAGVAPVVIGGVLRDYDWGIRNGLSDWTGRSTDGPEAELWFGAHPAAPSPILVPAGGPPTSLLAVLGPHGVPILTKILAAATPLSLQVHPTAARARQWRQTAAGRALLPDDEGKSEMLIALEDFTVLVGWRARREAEAILRPMGASQSVLARMDEGRPDLAVAGLLGPDRIEAPGEAWLSVIEGAGLDTVTVEAMRQVVNKFAGDPGVAVAALLQSQHLRRGDAVYLPVGVPHAYVHGRGIEVMTNSDNVLRMGLTSKAVSVEHAVSALDLAAHEQLIRDPDDGRYQPDGASFRVRLLEGPHRLAADQPYRLVLAVGGGVDYRFAGDGGSLDVGEALVLPAGGAEVEIVADGLAAVVGHDSPGAAADERSI